MARCDGSLAQGLLDAVIRAAERIGRYPLIGTVRPDLTPNPAYRFVVLPGYRYLIAYNANRNPPRIVRIVHGGARNLPRLLQNFP